LNDIPVMPPIDLARVEETLRTRYWCWILRSAGDGPLQLSELLKEKLPHIAPASWPDRFDFGGIYVNGLQALHDTPLPLPARVEYYEPKFDITSAREEFSKFTDDYIIFHDEAVAVVYKPPHLSSMPAKEQRHFSLKVSLERLLNRTIHMPSRLDISAQGLLAVSTAPEAHAGLQRAFEKRLVHKTYRFASDAQVAWHERLVNFNIAASPEHPVLRRASTTEGQTAQTEIRHSHSSASDGTPVCVYTAYPISGRTHQIRVHAAASGLPLIGDNFYGGARAPYLHLVSCHLSFPHPISGAEISFTLPESLSPAWVWKDNPPER
jgi:23S rRNA-/tRNA-specific pseudouridylate synthase